MAEPGKNGDKPNVERNDPGDRPGGSRRTARSRGPNMWLLILALVFLGFAIFRLAFMGPARSVVTYTFFLEQVKKGNVLQVEVGEEEALGIFKVAPPAPAVYDAEEEKLVVPKTPEGNPKTLEKYFRVRIPRDSQSLAAMRETLQEKDVTQSNLSTSTNAFTIFLMIVILLPLGFFIFMWITYRRARNDMLGGGFLSGFSKSPAKRYEATQQAVTFDDVAGLEGVKADLMEIVDYLRSSEKFQKLGGRVPKGVLLNGPPGTGKTLLARAVAGEAGVPFFSVSGSEFIQMFVGVGASRVRDLFKNAKEAAPAIIFIDEVDAVGRQRGAGLGGGHDEREQTLNQILSEMDGFTQTDTVIVLAATNRPDVLDPALLRPGRFDRHVTVGRPTHKGRVAIFKVHVRDVPLAPDVDLDALASSTIGLTGADIRNIVNEAALWAARNNKSKVYMEDFDYARDKILMGAKREEVLQEKEKETTAYHESGHALLAWMLPGAHQVHKVTIIPRGRALGVTQMFPTEDRVSMSENELRDQLVVLLGGRAAEQLVFNQMNVGAENDLERATGLARRMVTHWGMTDRLGPVSYKLSDEDPFLGREIHQQRQFSEHTMELIDEEVARILHESAERAYNLLSEHREDLNKLAQALLEKEEIDLAEIATLIGPSVQSRAKSNGQAAKEAKETKEKTT